MKKIIYLKQKQQKIKISVKHFSLGLMALGFLLIVLALWPIISFNLIIAPKFISMVKPVPESLLLISPQKQGFTGVNLLAAKGSLVKAQEEDRDLTRADYSKASVWFPTKPAITISQTDSKSYSLSIPKLKIKDALVIVGADDLSKSLIHYGGTSLPGEYGNSVVFGHSVLPYFYNPKDYKTIFSTLPSLSEDDEIFVNYGGITYRYKIEEMRVISPNDVSILEQRFDDSYLSLVTCVPPGTYEKRLWVKAKLTKI